MNVSVVATGNLVRDPEFRKTESWQVVKFSIAVTSSLKDVDGEYKPNYYECSLWGKPAEYVMTHAQKGTKVNVIGELNYEEYESRTGEKKTCMKINATKVDLLLRLKGIPVQCIEDDGEELSEF